MKKLKVSDYDDKQFINSTHKVNLTGGELSTILYIMEGYLQGSDDNQDQTFKRDCDRIFVELQSITDTWYEENQHKYVANDDLFDVEKCITNGEDYSDCVDKLVESMEKSNNE